MFLLEEYKTLREESKQASINMFVTLQLGAGFIGIALAAGFTQWEKSLGVSTTIFIVIVPLLSAFSMFIWLGEAIRFKRVGDYLCYLEQKISLLFSVNGAISAPLNQQLIDLQKEAETCLGFVNSPIDLTDPLCWEQWLRNTRPEKINIFDSSGHQTLVYLVRLMFFMTIAIMSFIIGTYKFIIHAGLDSNNYLIILIRSINPFHIVVTSGFLVILSTIVFGLLVAWKLNRRLKPIRYFRASIP